MNAAELDDRQKAALAAFRDTPEGAWVLEMLVVGNFILDPIPSTLSENEIERPLSEWERGICEGRRRLVLEIMDVLQAGIQDAYEVINRVDRMARGDGKGEHFADS